jgi:nitroreductase
MDLFETIDSRYSCRNLKPVEIPKEDIQKILDAGHKAPSGMNKQPCEFLVVTDEEAIAKIAEAQNFIENASAIIAIVANPEASQFWKEDMSAVAENMLLAVAALGYASTWVQGRIMPKENELKEYFGIPEKLRLSIALPLGKPADEGGQAAKKDLNEMTHWNKW